jgi:hypothetical protein
MAGSQEESSPMPIRRYDDAKAKEKYRIVPPRHREEEAEVDLDAPPCANFGREADQIVKKRS